MGKTVRKGGTAGKRKNAPNKRWIQQAVHENKEGSFTAYCGGKVTEQCIAKGLRSNNPKTRSRANFANIMRHRVKHKPAKSSKKGRK